VKPINKTGGKSKITKIMKKNVVRNYVKSKTCVKIYRTSSASRGRMNNKLNILERLFRIETGISDNTAHLLLQVFKTGTAAVCFHKDGKVALATNSENIRTTFN
jgi:hypothetical protein